MRRINLAEDIVPVGELRTNTAALLQKLQATRRPIVITQNGKPAAVILTPGEFEALEYRELVKAKIKAGLESAATGKATPSSVVRRRVKAKIRAVREG